MTHSAMIKTDSATDGEVTPNLVFKNNVFAIEDVHHHSYRSMFDAWDHTIESSNNYLLNLSDEPLPSDYPMPPAGWTVLQGQAARDYWAEAKANWIENHDGNTGTTVPPPVSEQPPVEEIPTASGSDPDTTTGSGSSTDGTSTATDGTSTTDGGTSTPTGSTTGGTSTTAGGTSTAGGTRTTASCAP